MTTDASPDTSPGGTKLWSIRAWRYAFPAALTSRFGDVIFDITVVLWISTEIARGETWAPAAVGGVLIAAAVPVLLVGPVAGVYVDRHDRHQILILSNVVQAVAIGSLLLIPAFGDALSIGAQLVWIYAAIALTNSAGQFFNQARMVMIVRTIPDELRISAFSVQGSANNLVQIVGPPLAAPLLFTAGLDWALAINACSFLASSALLGLVSWDSAPAPSTSEQGFWLSFADGVRVVAGNPLILAITVGVTIATLGAGAINVLDVFFVTDVLSQPAALLGVIGMAFAAGSIAGMSAAPWLERRVGAAGVFIWGLALSGLALVAYSRTTALLPAMLLLFVMAIPLGALNTAVMPLFMRSVPEEMLGRATVVLQIFPTVASLIAMGATGWLASTVLRDLDVQALGTHFGPIDAVFTAAGVLFVATALLVWRPIRTAANSNVPRPADQGPDQPATLVSG